MADPEDERHGTLGGDRDPSGATPSPSRQTRPSACGACLRRSRLLWSLGARLDVHHYDAGQLAQLMELPDRELLAALGLEHGETPDAPCRGEPGHASGPPGKEGGERASACRHHRESAGAFGAGWFGRTRLETGDTCASASGRQGAPGESCWGAPAVLHMAGDLDRLVLNSRMPVVSIVGTRRPTDYGAEVARRLGYELAGTGLNVLCGFADGVGSAALWGALGAGSGLACGVMLGGVTVCSPAFKRDLNRALQREGCAISELPPTARPRRWCYAARSRLLAGLADLVVVVEAECRRSDLMAAALALSIGRPVAAVPGRVTSPASCGTNDLLKEGVALVRDATDVLDSLAALGTTPTGRTAPSSADPAAKARTPSRGVQTGSAPRDARSAPRLTPGHDRRPELRALLAAVADGADTLERLSARGLQGAKTIEGLAELELSGALRRGDGGRYVPCTPVPGSSPPAAPRANHGRPAGRPGPAPTGRWTARAGPV
ncbi:MAG: DNA-processing protein DprA [Acidobacteriota bacterium]|nr:DNA-processing protein DprA [Acidobacteriota bacterium]